MLVHGPVFPGEDFDFGKAGEADVADRGKDAGDGIDAFAGEAAVEERVVVARFELADVEGEKMAVLEAGLDFRFKVRFPPNVECIDGDAY